MKEETIKVLEMEGKLLGLPLTDFAIWIGLTVLLIVLPTITDVVGIKLGTIWYYLFVAVVSISLNRLFKYFSKKKYPKYVMSMIAQIMQPKVVGARYGKKGEVKTKSDERK